MINHNDDSTKVNHIAEALRHLAQLVDRFPSKACIVLLQNPDGGVETFFLGDMDQVRMLGMLQLGMHEATHPGASDDDEPENKLQ